MFEGFRFRTLQVGADTVLIDPVDYPDVDDDEIEELEAEFLRRGFTVLREYLDDELGPRWGLRIVGARWS